MAHERLLGILQDLTADDFKLFQWHLEKDPDGSIPKCRLENATRQQTVDLMTQTYPGRAVDVTRKLLQKINRNDLAGILPDAGSGCKGINMEATDIITKNKIKLQYNPPSTPSTDPTTHSSEEEVKVLSCEHPEEHQLFCEEEQRAVCRICDSSHHPGHKLVPIEQAVNNLKGQLKSDLRTLKDKRTKYKHFKTRYNNEVVPHNKKQVLVTEKQIRAEFEKLHQILTEEEEARLAALREEEEQKEKTVSRQMKIIQEQISSLSDSISAVEQELQKHKVSFLSSYKHTQTSARVQCTLSDPQLDSGALIDVAKHLGNLSFTVCEKMKERVKFTPVILDPNTAADCLCLSEDLTSVRRAGTIQQLPNNTERFGHAADVLGSEGFSSGKHSWEVEVGDHPDWTIGLAKESVDRKGKKYASPKYGIWCLYQKDGVYDNGCNETISLQMNPERIRVQLDYDRGEVSFYDPEDMTHIYTHKDTFTDKLYPYFCMGKAGDAETIDIKICQVPVMEEILRSST